MIGALDLRRVARILGGEVVRGAVLAPGPGHSRSDRSLSVRYSVNSPDGFIVFSHSGDDFRTCRDFVRERLGLPQGVRRERTGAPVPHAAVQVQDDEGRIERAVAIWDEAQDPRGTPVEHYLVGRALNLDAATVGASLRFHPACPWKEKATGEMLRVPAMVAALRQVDTDRITAVHRTRLSADGVKLGRMVLGRAAGTAIKLDPDDVVTTGLTIGEGIETTLAARMISFRPAWAMGSAGAIGVFPVLSGVEALTVLAERDEASTRAIEQCASRWFKAGREVIVVEPRIGSDVNDALRGVT
ncbi:DUF7146 domain-containing protein [Lichenifustis flavocetrariae]|uniref:Toprim domain-containing protein n=1 Tax=Lichenifustis flavocetrariae TaxID=2949735 RepID=A0AA42CGT9_9HYPH|nr:toprim domain-containing protein [Lichenifustis flavocetrariae]MCW6506903.1 toprim domain-containing protein [Lichenifustis flavocetrariae]